MSTIHPEVARALEAAKDFQAALESLNASPNTAPVEGPGDGIEAAPSRSKLLSQGDIFEVRRRLRQMSTNEVYHVFSQQARAKNTGVPLEAWLAAAGDPHLAEKLDAGMEPDIKRLLDTTSGSALVRQDLEPVMYELFVRTFPAWDRIEKEPANGLVHTFTQHTGYGEAEFISELGTVSDDKGVYERQTTNVAIIGTRRGVTLKQQFAALQSGSGFNPEQREMRSALVAVAAKMQKTIFQGNDNPTESGGTATTEAGAYDPDGFTGLRQILNTVRAKNVDPFAGTPEDMRAAIERACVEIMDSGGSASLVWLRATDKATFDIQQDKNVRYMQDLVDVAVGVRTNAVNTVFGPLPLIAVPGNSIGLYSFTGPPNYGDTADLYLVDEQTVSMPYLGSEGPTVIEIPMGVGGQLTRLFIVFGMWGLAVKATQFSNKVRINQS